MNPIVKQFKYGQHTVTLETGAIARQATAAVMASMDDTTVFVTVVAKKDVKEGQKIISVYRSVPVQLAKENKKFKLQ